MSWNIDDPRWSSYLLGELSPAEIRDAEAFLKTDPALRAKVDSLRETLSLLQSALTSGDVPTLDDLRREAVLRERPARRITLLWFPSAAAALLVLVLGIQHFRPKEPLPETIALDVLSEAAPMGEMADLSLSSMPAEENQLAEGAAKKLKGADADSAAESIRLDARSFSAGEDLQAEGGGGGRGLAAPSAPAPAAAPGAKAAAPVEFRRARLERTDEDNPPEQLAVGFAAAMTLSEPLPSPTPTNQVEAVRSLALPPLPPPPDPAAP